MRLYMGFDDTLGAGEGACLIFANTAREAKKIGHYIIQDWFGTEWIDMRAKWIRHDIEFLKQEADQEKLKNNISHVIESPQTCSVCLLWGATLINGVCEDCVEEEQGE